MYPLWPTDVVHLDVPKLYLFLYNSEEFHMSLSLAGLTLQPWQLDDTVVSYFLILLILHDLWTTHMFAV